MRETRRKMVGTLDLGMPSVQGCSSVGDIGPGDIGPGEIGPGEIGLGVGKYQG